MRHRITAHVRGNVVGYIALGATLAGTSYAALGLRAASVGTAALDNTPVTRITLAGRSVYGTNPGTDPSANPSDGTTGGPTDPTGANGTNGTSSIGARARASSVVATKGGGTNIPLSGNSWTQAAGEIELLAGTVAITVPSSCTGGFGNALTLSVDGNATTFAAAPVPPASGTVTMPFVIGTLSEPSQATQHKLTAKFGNSCSKDGENYTIKDLKIDVLKFH
jgi:hypothetical protein